MADKVYLGGHFFEIQKKRHCVYGGEAIFLTQNPHSWVDPKSTFFKKRRFLRKKTRFENVDFYHTTDNFQFQISVLTQIPHSWD